MQGHSIKIVGFGLPVEDKKNGWHRQVIFKDLRNNKTAELLVYQKERPTLWADVEKLEKGENLEPYSGYVTKFNGVDTLVLGDETLHDAFERQSWQLDVKEKISSAEAEKIRLDSMGYITNLTPDGGMDVGWRDLDPDVKMIKYRYYKGNGEFYWTDWYEIE